MKRYFLLFRKKKIIIKEKTDYFSYLNFSSRQNPKDLVTIFF